MVTLPKPTIADEIPLTVPVNVGLLNITALLSLVTLPTLVVTAAVTAATLAIATGTAFGTLVSVILIVPLGDTLTENPSKKIVVLLKYSDLNFFVGEPKS